MLSGILSYLLVYRTFYRFPDNMFARKLQPKKSAAGCCNLLLVQLVFCFYFSKRFRVRTHDCQPDFITVLHITIMTCPLLTFTPSVVGSNDQSSFVFIEWIVLNECPQVVDHGIRIMSSVKIQVILSLVTECIRINQGKVKNPGVFLFDMFLRKK